VRQKISGEIPLGSAIIARQRSRPQTVYDLELATLRSEEAQTLKANWQSFLGAMAWTHFITITFAEPRYMPNADSTLLGIFKAIRRFSGRGRIFVGTELHASTALHVHGLVNATQWPNGHAFAVVLWRQLFELYGRTTVSEVQDGQAVADYVCKYVTKEFTAYMID